jgi:hypothetical protein
MYLATCPVCGRKFDLHAASVPPFCSARCRRIDLGRWLGEEYAIPVDPDDDEPDDESQAPERTHEED